MADNNTGSSNNEKNNNSDNENSENEKNENSENGNTIIITQLNTPIENFTMNETIVQPGLVIVNQQGSNNNGIEVTHTTFNTTDPINHVPVIKGDLEEDVVAYYDDTVTNTVLDEIKLYAGKIQCSDFHGKGTIDDYNGLFVAAAKIANDTKQMQLDVDVDGFNEFGQAADELSALFNSFIIKLQNVSIINDTTFLQSVALSLKKIWNLSEVFGRFKKTILATSTVEIPKSAHDTKIILEGVMSEVNCAMKYITHFVSPSTVVPIDANLSTDDKRIIDTAVSTIENWNILCDQGVTIAMSNNTDIQYINNANNELKTKSSALKNATNLLKLKLAQFNIIS